MNLISLWSLKHGLACEALSNDLLPTDPVDTVADFKPLSEAFRQSGGQGKASHRRCMLENHPRQKMIMIHTTHS